MLIGQQVGPFEVVSEVGSGAMGTVYRAKWPRDGKNIPVALKVIALGLASNDGAMARFEREANILKQLRHPHIVRLYGTGRYMKTPFIAMEFVNGEGLDRILARRGKMSWEDVVVYAKQLCDALQHAHEKGIIHRDLKPSNLMITPDGQLKLTDFGIAKDTDVTALTGANSTIGTAAYMSPEQCKGDRNISAKSDLYSLGIVLYELITGRKPFTADTTVEMFLKHVNERPVRPGKLVPDLPVWLDNLIMFLLEKERDQRPLDAATVRKILEEIEVKVNSQQSIGAEVANARRVDRPVRDGTLDESDKELARSLRPPGKKKKKKRTDESGRIVTMLKAGLILAVLAGIVGLIVYAVWPEGMSAAYTRVQQAPPGDARKDEAANFLKRYRGDTDSRVAEVRDIYKAELIRHAEDILAKRHGMGKMRNNSEGFPEEAFKSAMLAIDAEETGQLTQANSRWTATRDSSPAADEGAILDTPQEAVLRWVAEKRLRDIQQCIQDLPRKLKEQISNDRTNEAMRTYDNLNDPEQIAHRARRLELIDDRAKAKAEWNTLAKLTEKEFDKRGWYLLGTSRSAELGPAPQEGNELPNRRTLLQKKLEELETKWAEVHNDVEARVKRREFRCDCRDIIELYGKEQDEVIQGIVEKAKKLLASIPRDND